MAATYSVCNRCEKVNKYDTEKAADKRPTCGSCGAELPAHDGLTELDVKQVRKLLAASPVPVVIDFWAPWCAPCRSFGPVFQEAAKSFAGKVVFVKLNTEEDEEAGASFGIRGIPTVIMFKNGQEFQRQSGAMPPATFNTWIKQGL